MNTFNLFQFFSLSAMEVMDFTIDCIVSCPILVPFYCVLVLVFVCTISLSAKTIVFVVKCCKITFSYYMFNDLIFVCEVCPYISLFVSATKGS